MASSASEHQKQQRLKRGREEWNDIVDLIAADHSTDASLVPRGVEYNLSAFVPRTITSEANEFVDVARQALEAWRASQAFQSQMTISDGYHSKPIPIRVTDFFSKRISAKDTDSQAVMMPNERRAAEIGPTVLGLASRVGKLGGEVRNEDLDFGTTHHLTTGFRRERFVQRQYPVVNFIPIILVPSAASAPIQMFNVREFLEQGRYVHPSNVYMSVANGSTNREQSKPENLVVSPDAFFRVQTSPFQKFRVLDDPRQVGNWDHVCACIATGADWQFAEWFPNLPDANRSPSFLFDFMRGFVTYFEEDRLPVALSRWKVHPLVLTRKYVKAEAHIHQAFSFWEELYKFLAVHPRFSHYTAPSASSD